MRHFFQSATATVGALAGSVAEGPTARALVAAAGPADRCPAGDPGAPLAAVRVPPVALIADPYLPPAPRAVVESVALLDHRNPTTRRTGQRVGVAASYGRVLSHSITAITQKARGITLPGPSPSGGKDFLSHFRQAGVLRGAEPLGGARPARLAPRSGDGEQIRGTSALHTRFRRDSSTIDTSSSSQYSPAELAVY